MTKQKPKIPKYSRSSTPPPIRLTERDILILETIHSHDGMLSISQIQFIFFTGESQTKKRLMLLYQNRFLNRPNREQRRRTPEMIYWLDKRGADIVASRNSLSLHDFKWLKIPRWFQLEHDIAVNDFRIDMEQTCHQDDVIEIEEWIAEREFRSFPDKIKYTYQNRGLTRNIIPDGYFMLSVENRNIRYLLEIDRGTEDNPRFLREKILPGLAYIKSSAYKNRFGINRGRWLVVTTSERRLANMLRQAHRAEAKGIFFFTTFEAIKEYSLLHAPIWSREDQEEPVPLIQID